MQALTFNHTLNCALIWSSRFDIFLTKYVGIISRDVLNQMNILLKSKQIIIVLYMHLGNLLKEIKYRHL